MKNFEFILPVKIIFGKDAQKQVGVCAARYGKKAMILYGSERIRRNGLLDEIQLLLKESGVDSVAFGGICENPLLSTASRACRYAKLENIDLLIAIGGGSVIDTAKAVSIGFYSEDSLWDFYEQKREPNRSLPVGVVLTMAATASEANCKSVIRNGESGVKKMLMHPLLFPVFSLMNPELTYTVPAYQTAVGAADIFSHAFERYFYREQKGTLRLELCSAVMRTVVKELPKALVKPDDYDARSQLMWAATMAHSDMIGTEGVYACHALSHILTAEFELPHGAALAILMLAWCKYMLPCHPKALAEFAVQVWGVQSEGKSAETVAQEGISRFQEFLNGNGLPDSMRDAGIVRYDSLQLAKRVAAETPCLGEGFAPLYEKDIQAIFEVARR